MSRRDSTTYFPYNLFFLTHYHSLAKLPIFLKTIFLYNLHIVENTIKGLAYLLMVLSLYGNSDIGGQSLFFFYLIREFG